MGRKNDEPRWLAEFSRHGADPLAIYDHTYGSIAASDQRPARRRTRLGTVLFLLVSLAIAAVAARPHTLLWLRQLRDLRLPVHAIETPRPLPTPRPAYAPDVIGTTPARPKATVRVGEEREFAVAAVGPEMHYSWTVDGTAVGTGPRWSYVPAPGDAGVRRVEVVVTAREGTERRAWVVRVRPPHPPEIRTEPAPGAVELASGAPLRLRVAPVAAAERVRTRWQVNGAPAGEGDSFTLRPDRPGVTSVRAVVQTESGATAAREWRVDVAAPPPPPPVQVASAPPPPPAPSPAESEPRSRVVSEPPSRAIVEPPTRTVAEPPSRAVAEPPSRTVGEPPSRTVAEPPTRTVAEPPSRAVAEPPSRAVSDARAHEVALAVRADPVDQDVRRWLERYAAAWRAHDVEALRRMGQVTDDREADALREYFERVHDLDVELNVIALSTDGDRTTVRFTRRDRFRDPAGRLVLKESPTLVKQIVRTPTGLRFARPTG